MLNGPMHDPVGHYTSHKLSKQLLDIIRDKEGDLTELERIVIQADKSTDWRSLAAAGDKLIRLQR